MSTVLSVARGILLRGSAETGRRLDRDALFKAIGNVRLTTFRSAAADLGAQRSRPGLRFFDSSVNGKISFGPGAGLAVGASVGAESIRAVLVDANGWEYHPVEGPRLVGQSAAEPGIVLSRIKETVACVLDKALDDSSLLVDGNLPLLGWAVAWPTPIDRGGRPNGYALGHHSWRSGQPLNQRVALTLGVTDMAAFSLNDAHAAAIAIAHHETHQLEHLKWTHPKLTVVVRLAGNVSGAVIIVEPKRSDPEHGDVSGFVGSILLAGIDNCAGEIGHAPISRETIEEIDDRIHVNGLSQLVQANCSCTPTGGKTPAHLEAYASVLALTQRLYPDLEHHDALQTILTDPDNDRHTAGLRDVGTLVGDTMIGPIAILNPAAITLTGTLAMPVVRDEVRSRVDAAHRFGTQPAIGALRGQVNDYVSAKGAALAMIRNLVHRRMDEILDDYKDTVSENVAGLAKLIDKNPLS
jgi:predicted NBD/HSP70 family sugar kinase